MVQICTRCCGIGYLPWSNKWRNRSAFTLNERIKRVYKGEIVEYTVCVDCLLEHEREKETIIHAMYCEKPNEIWDHWDVIEENKMIKQIENTYIYNLAFVDLIKYKKV